MCVCVYVCAWNGGERAGGNGSPKTALSQAFSPGDKVQFTRADTLEGFGTAVVRSAALLTVKGCGAAAHIALPCQQELQLDIPLLGARLNMDVVENIFAVPDISITGVRPRSPHRCLVAIEGGRGACARAVVCRPP